MSKNPLICVGQITSAHGIRGEVKIKSFTANPEDIGGYGDLTDEAGEKSFSLRLRSALNNMVIAGVKGVTSRSAAEELRGTKLFMARSKLPKPEEGRFYMADLVGLEAVDAEGNAVGRVTDAMNFGAGDIIAVKNEAGREWMLPFKEPFAKTPDMEKRVVVVSIPAEYPFSETKKKEKPKK
jgi:16S rRNA processing protein RimM